MPRRSPFLAAELGVLVIDSDQLSKVKGILIFWLEFRFNGPVLLRDKPLNLAFSFYNELDRFLYQDAPWIYLYVIPEVYAVANSVDYKGLQVRLTDQGGKVVRDLIS